MRRCDSVRAVVSSPAERLEWATRDLHKLMESVQRAGGLPGQRTLLIECKSAMDAIHDRANSPYLDDDSIDAITTEVERIAAAVLSVMPGGNPA